MKQYSVSSECAERIRRKVKLFNQKQELRNWFGEITAWAIFVDGYWPGICYASIDDTRLEAIQNFISKSGGPWKYYYRRGHRARRIKIKLA